MKRMSDVFELPIDTSAAFAYGYATIKDAAIIGQYPAAQHAAYAINHVDSLADALQSVLNMPRGTSGRIIIEKEDELTLIAALSAYRGRQ
jgi:hypothetical protein